MRQVPDVEVDDEADVGQPTTSLRQVVAVLRPGEHHDPGGQLSVCGRRQAEVQAAVRHLSSDVPTAVVLQQNVQLRAQHIVLRLGAVGNGDRLDLRRRVRPQQTTEKCRIRKPVRELANGAISAHHPVAGGGEDAVRRAVLARRLRVDAADARHEELDAGLVSNHVVARLTQFHNVPPGVGK